MFSFEHVILISFFLVFAAGGRDCDICLYDERQKRTTVVAMKNRGWFESMISVKPFKSKNRDKIHLDATNPNLIKGSDSDF